MRDYYDDFDPIRSELTRRQIELLRHFIQPLIYQRSGTAADADVDALLRRKLIERVEGAPHKESFSRGRSVSTPGVQFESTDKGRSWLNWYDGRT